MHSDGSFSRDSCIVNPRGPVPRGVSDFTELVEDGFVFVDKTLFIKEVLDSGDKVILLTRPRRFGKTINLNMLRCFLHWPPDHQPDLFDGLAISKAGERQGKAMTGRARVNPRMKTP
ncbi:MAG: AAA family ATPase [Myxococcota bacterium]